MSDRCPLGYLLYLSTIAGGHNDTGEYWKSWYESDTFEEDLQNLLDELQPLYESLHAYIRNKLTTGVYMEQKHKFPHSGHIPAHLLGECSLTVAIFG